MPRTATSVADTVGALMPEPVIVIDESSTSGLAQAGAPGHDWLKATGAAISYAIRGPRCRDHRPDPPDSSPMDTTSGLCTPAPENLDVTTVTEPQRYRRHRAHPAPTPRGRVRPRHRRARPPRFGPPSGVVKLAEDIGVAPRRVHTADELAHARRGAVIQPGAHLNRRDGALSAALTITGSSTGPLGDTHVRGRGCPTRSGSTPTRSPGGHSHPRAGGSGRPDPASTPAGRHRPAVQTGGRPAICSSGCGHPGQTRPSFAPAATIRPSRPATVGAAPNRRTDNHPAGQDRTRCSPRHRRRQATDVICCQVVHQPTAVTVSAFLRLSQQLRRGVQHRRRGDATDAAVAVADGNADRGWGCRRRRCRRSRLAVAADVGRC